MASFRPVLLAVLTFCAAIRGQTVTSTLVGTITDSSGAAVTQALITATHVATNSTRTAQTNERGDYVITYLRPGTYTVTAEHTGFRKAVVDQVELVVEQTARIDLSLQLGAVTETVDVTAIAPLVASETSSVGQVITQNQIINLPLKGRNFYELALLAPGTTPQMPGSFVGNRRPTPGGLNAPAFYVGGAREASNGYIIDGVDAQDPHYLTPSIFPSVDAIQEFRLQTNAYSAEYGRFAAQINATTRAGTNEWHGTAYEFVRNDKLDAASFFDNFSGLGKAPLRYNQFGGTVGGPLTIPRLYKGKDRTFFFASYEGTRIRRGRTAQLNVPTTEQRNGDFSRLGFRGNQPIFDPATTRTVNGVVVRDQFPGNVIPPNRISNFARQVLSLYPAPTSDVVSGNNYFAALSDNSDNNQFLVRGDHRFSDRDNIFFRYALFDGLQTNKSPIDQGGQSTDVRTHNMGFNYIHVFAPSLLNELRLGYNRPVYLILQEGAFKRNWTGDLGIRNLLSDPIAWGVPALSITGYSGIGSGLNPTTQVSNVYQIVDHISLTRGSHSIKFGTDLRKTNYNDRSEVSVRGDLGFTGGMTANPGQARTGVSIADLLLGLPLTAAGSGTSLAGNFNAFTYSFFVQDDWKVARNLTLNVGVRYEYNTRYTDVQNRMTFFDPNFPGGRLLIAGSNNTWIPGRGLVQSDATTSRGLIPPDRNNWAPRLGLAWRPFGTNRTAVRAGYGVFYSIVELQEIRTWVRNPPFGEVMDLRSDQNANSTSPSVIRVEELFPSRGTVAARPNAYSPTGAFPDPYYQQWNFSIQQELPAQILVETGYMGSKGTKLIQRVNYNQAVLDADPLRPTPILNRRPFPLFGNTLRIGDNSANSTYHAGFVRLERRFANGVSFQLAYTYAKSLDAASLIDGQPRDIFNRSLDKGRSQFDIRQRLVASGTWELPFGRGKRWLADTPVLTHVLGGWQVNSILSTRSGFPFSVNVQGDICNCGAANQTANQTGDPWAGDVRRREQWFNRAAFVNPFAGKFGTSGRNILSGPGAQNVDLSLFRNIALTERRTLQFRGEFFNVMNHTNFGQPNAQVGSPNYAVIQSAGDPRTVQLALKFRF